ncbi:MAG TPA: ABC transporter permease [Candidatus Binatia bacterium]|nr:ABC transporter permease [Candidatus Binatia bacterium]
MAAGVEAIDYAGGTLARAQVGLWRDGLRRLRRNRLALAAAIYLILLAAMCILSLFWTPYNPNLVGTCPDYTLPGPGHPLGCDDLGRDTLSRLMVGSQVSLTIGLVTAVIVMVLGVGIGLMIGYLRGVVDAVFALIINTFYGVPPLMVAIVLYVLLGPGLINIIIAIAATSWMDMARLVRGQTLSIREREFIEAARSSGARTGKILFGHVFPNALGPIIVQTTFVVPAAILTGAFFSFLGFGVPAPTADWGGMASEGFSPLLAGYDPYMLLFPAVFLSVTLLAFNFFGDGLRDAFDPRQRR